MKKTFRALTCTVAVEIDDDLPYADVARGVVATYPTSDASPALTYQLRRRVLARSGAADRQVDDDRDLVPVFELDLYEQVIACAQPGWILHAAAIEVAGEALVFAGPSGAGKTTMALALVARGHRLLTEEIVAIDRSRLVRGLARPLHVVAGDPMPPWPRIPYPIRDGSGESRERAIVLPPRELVQHDPLPLRALVRLTHGADRDVALTQLSPRDALPRFWDPTLRQDDAGLATATDVLRTTPAYRLSSRSFAEALAGLEALLK